LLGLLIGLACPVGYYYWRISAAQADLRAAIEEVERAEPVWRLEDLEAARTPVPEASNGSLVVTAAAGKLPPSWRDNPIFEQIDGIRPPIQLTSSQEDALRKALAPAAPALQVALQLRDRDGGRYSVTWTDDFFNTPTPHVDDVRPVGDLLLCEAALRSQEGNALGALEALQAALNVGRSFGDEPLYSSQLRRIGIRAWVDRALERALALGLLPEGALAEMQQVLTREADEPTMPIGIRGERAGLDHFFIALEAGPVSLSQLQNANWKRGSPTWRERLTDVLAQEQILRAHAWVLRYLTEALDVLRRPTWEQERAFQELEAKYARAPVLARLFVPDVGKTGAAEWRTQADLRCAITALAVERYRILQAGWPENLEAVVSARLLKEIPRDPYDGQPLRFRTTADGAVVYSVGPQRNYRGDALDGPAFDPDAPRPEFRLWNVESRRQSPQGSAPGREPDE
jgi:hypothetical protein